MTTTMRSAVTPNTPGTRSVVDHLAGPLWRRAKAAAAATPPERDRVVDLLRSGSLAVVILGHVVMALVVWHGGVPTLGNTLTHAPAMQLATWALQIMPLFFVAGGISNAISWQRASGRGVEWRVWVFERLARLVRPVAVYLTAWVPLVLGGQYVLGKAAAEPLAAISTQLLWFLGVYVPVTALTPWMVRRARSAPWATPAALLAVAAMVDLIRFNAGVGAVALVNFVVVWVMSAQLGLAITHRRPSNHALVAMAGAGLAVNAALVASGPYPMSMVGLPGERLSNMAPPTLVLAVHCWVLAALAALAWEQLDRLAQRPRAWTAVVAIGGASMTLYLWHLTALIGVTVAEHHLGLDRDRFSSAWFWPETAVHVLVVVGVAWVLANLLASVEHARLPWLDTPARGRGGVAWSRVGLACCAVAFLVLAATGMAGFPFSRLTHYLGIPLSPGVGFILLAVGVWAARRGAATRS